MEKPTLHEIAAMPFPASLQAMRRFYNPDWGKPVPDGATLGKWSVQIEYTYTAEDRETVEVEAFTEEEALEAAADKIAARLPAYSDMDIVESAARLIDVAA